MITFWRKGERGRERKRTKLVGVDKRGKGMQEREHIEAW